MSLVTIVDRSLATGGINDDPDNTFDQESGKSKRERYSVAEELALNGHTLDDRAVLICP